MAVLMVVSLMALSFVPVFADTTTQAGISDSAKLCADLGMLKGTGSGVTIEYTSTTPDRLTAAILLLRLKGLEQEALATKETDNFSDASLANANGQKIMAYLKANPSLGFEGFPNGKFGPKDKMTAQQYYKVLLINLGYASGTDFKYNEVFDFAATKGLTQLTADTEFTVDSLAVATVEALKAAINGGKETLAVTLVSAGKLDATIVATAGLDKATSTQQAIDSTATYMSKGENFGWQNYGYTLGTNTTGKQLIEYDVTALIEKVDGSVDFADSSTEVGGFSDLAMLIRLSSDGFFDARNGAKGQQKIADVPFKANLKYHVEIYADMNVRNYSVFVTTPEGVRTQIAKDFSFRVSAPDTDDVGQVFFISAAANDQLKVENLTRRALIDSTAAYMSKGENNGWQEYGYYMGSKNTGKQQIDYDMTALIDKVDGSVDFVDSSISVGGFSDLAMLIRMSGDGFIDVRNGAGGQQKLVDFPYSANIKYHVEIQADMSAKTYSVFVTAPGGQKTQIAKDYAFRASASETDDVGQVFVISAAANDQVKAENITIKALQ
jgi:hypothetical protein